MSASSGDPERPAEELRESHVRSRLHGLALELIDLLVDALQSGSVAGAKIPAAGSRRDIGEQRFIDAHRSVLIPEPEEATADGNGRHSFGADANRVDLDAERGGRLRRGARVDRAAIVLTVGEEDDHLRPSRRVRRRLAAVAIAVPIAVPSSNCPGARLSTAALTTG